MVAVKPFALSGETKYVIRFMGMQNQLLTVVAPWQMKEAH